MICTKPTPTVGTLTPGTARTSTATVPVVLAPARNAGTGPTAGLLLQGCSPPAVAATHPDAATVAGRHSVKSSVKADSNANSKAKATPKTTSPQTMTHRTTAGGTPGKQPVQPPEPQEPLPVGPITPTPTPTITPRIASAVCDLLGGCGDAELRDILGELARAMAPSGAKGNKWTLLVGSKLKQLLEGMGVVPASGSNCTAADVAALSDRQLQQLRAVLQSRHRLLQWFLVIKPTELPALSGLGAADEWGPEDVRAVAAALSRSGYKRLAELLAARAHRQPACSEGASASSGSSSGGDGTALPGMGSACKAQDTPYSPPSPGPSPSPHTSPPQEAKWQEHSSSSNCSSSHPAVVANQHSAHTGTNSSCGELRVPSTPEALKANGPVAAAAAAAAAAAETSTTLDDFCAALAELTEVHLRDVLNTLLGPSRPKGWNTLLFAWLAVALPGTLLSNGTARSMSGADVDALVSDLTKDQVLAVLRCPCKDHELGKWLARYLHLLGLTAADFWFMLRDAGLPLVKPKSELMNLQQLDRVVELLGLRNADGTLKNFSNAISIKGFTSKVWCNYMEGGPSAGGAFSGIDDATQKACEYLCKQLDNVPLLYLWRIDGRVVYVGQSAGVSGSGNRILSYVKHGPRFGEGKKMLQWLKAIDAGKEIELLVIPLDGMTANDPKVFEKRMLDRVDFPLNKQNNGDFRGGAIEEDLVNRMKIEHREKAKAVLDELSIQPSK